MSKSPDYQIAKDIVDTMQLHEEVSIKVVKLPNFRKYLREIVFKRTGNEQFATRKESSQVKVIRIR